MKGFSFFLLMLSLGCGNPATEQKQVSQPDSLVQTMEDAPSFRPVADTSLIAVIRYGHTKGYTGLRGKPAALSIDDLAAIDSLVKQAIADHNKTSEDLYRIPDLARYKRQYITAVNVLGEKEVWVNCFCSDHGQDWKRQVISVDDGGSCYFSLVVNLTQRRYYRFGVNGTG